MTELTDCERTSDKWLRSVQEEFRHGKLTRDTHAFLHGEPTLQPGSVLGDSVKCGNKKCKERSMLMAIEENVSVMRRSMLAQETLAMECKRCRDERGKRFLVARTDEDPRFQLEKFQVAPAIFPNNDIKYEVNKLRAQGHASKTGTGIMYCPAKDTPSAEALRVRTDLASQKVSWLNRHDRESGDLYGVLPLIKGMPVAMTDHIDRSVDKRLLRGRVGYVHSWVLADDEKSVFENGKRVLRKLPKVVYVKFFDSKGKPLSWQLPGMKEPGVYPIVPVRRDWFLDKGRLHPQLKIRRRQLPLTPAFAMTAHAAQGQTFSKGAIVDLNIGGSSSTMSSYVAMTRVERREDLLIYRPFPLELFNKGQKPGMDLLLRVWRHDKTIDWEAIEKEHMPSKFCPNCRCVKKKQLYHKTEWKRTDKDNHLVGNCMMCMARHTADGEPCQCTVCWTWLPEDAFPEHQRSWQSSHNRVCMGCVEKRVCKKCDVLKCAFEFTDKEWQRASWPQSIQGRCKGCMVRSQKHMWHCRGCNESKPAPHEFSEWLKERGTQHKRPGARCNYCTATAKQAREEQRAKTVSMVVKGADPTPEVATAPALTEIGRASCRERV